MSLLTVDVGGANETVLPFARAGHAEPRQVGKRRYAFAGNERSMIRSEPMVIPLVGANLPPATVATLRSIFAIGAQVLCQGDVFNNGNALTYCSGEISDEMEVGGTYWIPTLTLFEVSGRQSGIFVVAVAPAGLGVSRVTINGKRRSTIAIAGAATTTVTIHARRKITVAPAGQATTSARTRRQQINVAPAGQATTLAHTKRNQINVAPAGVATTTVSLHKKSTASASGTSTAAAVVHKKATAAASGSATVSARTRRQQINVAPSGAATTTANLHAKRKITVAPAGRGTPTATGTKIP